jgi:hypothetical protein
MKEKAARRETLWEEYASKARFCLLIVLLALPAGEAGAQSCPWNNMFYHGEGIVYDLYFKWGIIMPRAGLARFTVKDARYEGKQAWEYKLTFNTAGMFDRIFKMRDTLATWFTPDCRLLFSDKHTDEGGYYLVDEMSFSPPSGNKIAVHSRRYTRNQTKIDTTLVVDQGCVFDMMAATMYLRSIRWKDLKINDEFPFQVVVGRDLVRVRFRYTGQAIVTSSGETLKYRTHHFYIDVYDPAFEQSREAAEVWMGDDENHIPIRVRAKLKIGAAEVYFKEEKNLQYPFACRIAVSGK